MENSTAREESLSKVLYKTVLYLVKVVPLVIALLSLLNTVLSYYCIDLPLFSYISQYLFIMLMYVTSHTFKFCKWHRIVIHYILIIFTLNIIDYHIGIPLSDRDLYLLYVALAGISLVIAIILKFKVCKHSTN